MMCSPSIYENLTQKAVLLDNQLVPIETIMSNLFKIPSIAYVGQLPRASDVENLKTAGEEFLNAFREYTRSSQNRDIDVNQDPAIGPFVKIMERYQKIISAIHEASHAVVASILELDNGAITVNPDGYLTASFRVFPPQPGESNLPQWAERVVVMGKAGLCGANLVTDYIHAVDGAQADRKMIASIAEEYHIDKETIDVLSSVCIKLTAWAFPVIFLVATGLLKEHTLQPPQLEKLYIAGTRALRDDEKNHIQEQLASLSQMNARSQASCEDVVT